MKTLRIITLITALAAVNSVFAQGKFFVNSYVQFVSGKFEDGAKYSSVFFYNGIKYQARDLFLSLNIPFVAISSNGSADKSGGIPKATNTSGILHSEEENHMALGFGDLYFNLSYEIISQGALFPAVSLDGYVKAPTASKSLGIGSGSFDYFTAIGLRKNFERFLLFAQFGYLTLGEVVGSRVDNPFTLSAGVGYLLGSNNQSLYLGYDSYSTIIQGHVPPKQLSFGYNYAFNPRLIFSAIFSLPLDSENSDLFFSGGFNYEL